MTPLLGKRILLGITGGIAAYKSAELLRLLKKAGAEVQVVMTKGAQAFITPLTFQALSGLQVRTELLDTEAEAAMGHIELAKWADLIVIAPASADFIAKLGGGIADDLLSTLCLATAAQIAVAPAMNQQMWAAESTSQNIAILQQRNFKIWGPATGEQACGDTGLGRMQEAAEIAVNIEEFLGANHTLAGVKVLLTAGPTYEAIDPVRFIGNRSSGKMGYALAEAFIEAGAEVILVSGPVNSDLLEQYQYLKPLMVESAEEMRKAVLERIESQQVFVGCAAVSDYRVDNPPTQKIKKQSDELVLTLVKNPDIISEVASSELRPTLVVGFAAETENLLENAQSKLERKQLDLICANDVSDERTTFGSDLNRILLLSKGDEQLLELASKKQQAQQIVEKVAYLLSE